MNNLFSGSNEVVYSSSSIPSFGLTGNVAMIIFFALFAFVVSYMVVGKALPSLTAWIPSPVPISTQVYFQSKRVWPPSGNTSNLTAYPAKFGQLTDTAYSFNMDLVLKETRTNDTRGLHRHIFHRGSDEYASSNPGQVLPRRMNPGVFLDPLTNDLLVFVDTLNGNEGYRESLRIADIPLSSPMRLGLVLSNRTLDVYINCRLEETKMLRGTPKTVENRLFGVAGPSPAPVQLQNLYTWNYALGSDSMTHLCGTAPVFTLTPTCGVASGPSGPSGLLRSSDASEPVVLATGEDVENVSTGGSLSGFVRNTTRSALFALGQRSNN